MSQSDQNSQEQPQAEFEEFEIDPKPDAMGVVWWYCAGCKTRKPKENFKTNSKQRFCFECRQANKEERRTEKEVENLKTIIGQLVEVTEAGPEPAKFDRLVASMVRKFGGMDGFVERWYENFDLAIRNRPGSAGVLQHFQQVFKLIAESNKHQRADDIAQMSMEQIQAEQKRLTLEMILQACADEQRSVLIGQLLKESGLSKLEVFGVDHVQ